MKPEEYGWALAGTTEAVCRRPWRRPVLSTRRRPSTRLSGPVGSAGQRSGPAWQVHFGWLKWLGLQSLVVSNLLCKCRDAISQGLESKLSPRSSDSKLFWIYGKRKKKKTSWFSVPVLPVKWEFSTFTSISNRLLIKGCVITTGTFEVYICIITTGQQTQPLLRLRAAKEFGGGVFYPWNGSELLVSLEIKHRPTSSYY